MSDLLAIRSPGFDDAAGPVALFLHGYGSNEHDLAGLAGYLPERLAWASVRAPLRHPASGYAWYALKPDDFVPEDGVGTATAALWSWIDDNVPEPCTLVPFGFSQGGLMATQLVRTRPERVGAAVVLSGFVADAPQSADAVLADVRTPVFWGRGDADLMVPPHLVDAAGRWLAGHAALEQRVYPGLGHSVSDAELADVQAFLAEALRSRAA